MIKLLGHITLSVVLLLSATGLTINMHFCNNQLYDIALITPAHDCCEVDGAEESCHHQDQNKSHKCDDEIIKVGATNDFFVSNYSFDFEDSHPFDLFFPTQLLIDIPLTDEISVSGLFNYKNPPPHGVVLSQIQSFRI